MDQHAAHILKEAALKKDGTGMNNHAIRLPLQLFLLFFGIVPLARAQGLIVEPADIIVIHGRVYTQNAKQPWAQAVAIHGARIVEASRRPSLHTKRRTGPERINASGK